MTSQSEPLVCEIVTTIRVMGMKGAESAVALTTNLLALNGVIDVEVATRLGRVTVAYDAIQIKLKAIEEAIAALGYPLEDTLTARLLRSLHYFTEENAVDTMRRSQHSSYALLADKGVEHV